MKIFWTRYGYALAVIVVGAVILGFDVWVTGRKGATTLEIALCQFILFAIGLGVSFWFGSKSAAEGAKDVVRPHGRSAIRRLASLARFTQRIRRIQEGQGSRLESTAADNNQMVGIETTRANIEIIDSLLEEQVLLVAEAIEDWRDVLPAELQRLTEEEAG